MVVVVSGKQGAGKSTLCDTISRKLGPCAALKHRFAAPLYEMHNACRNILQKYGITNYDFSTKDGDLLQLLGTEWGRKKIGENVWAQCTFNAIQSAPRNIIHLIEDCRFKNEFEAFKKLPDCITVRLNCPEEIRKTRAEHWRENTSHPSEIDLDEYAETNKFDMNFNTQFESVDEIAEKVVMLIKMKKMANNTDSMEEHD